MKGEGQTFSLPKKSSIVGELFTTQEQRDDDKREKVMEIPISEIDDFPDQPFQVRMDEAMAVMVDSVKLVGVQTPAIARQKEDGRYELISGHRRKMAVSLAGLETLPVIVRQMNRDEAIIALVDANLQREIILPSEKAKSYKLKLDAVKRQQGERTDLTSATVLQKSDGKSSREIIAESSPDSHEQIRKFICLNDLIPELLQMVDDCATKEKDKPQIAMRPAVELSYLKEDEQLAVLEAIGSEDCTPSHEQAIKMRRYSQEGKLGENVILSIMQEEKPNQAVQFKIPHDKISRFFSPGTPKQKMEDTIVKALEMWKKREQSREAR